MEAQGFTGGVMTLWKEDAFCVKASINNSRCIILAGELLGVKKDMVFCNVYAANFENERVDLWDFILQAQVLFPFPWCIGGDFNTVLSPDERRGRWCNMGSIRNFNAFILQAGVVDIPIHGSSFTWSNNREVESWARLDRFLCDPVFLSWFLDLVQRGLSKSVSDHNPVWIGVLVMGWGLDLSVSLTDGWRIFG